MALDRPMLISFRGGIGVGKTTAAHYLRDGHNFKVLSFADPLREMVKELTPDGKIDKVRDRALMQTVGDEARSKNPDVFVNHLLARMQKYIACGFHVAIDDARVDNELNLITDFHGKHVFLIGRPHEVRINVTRRDGGYKEPPPHSTEALNDPADMRHFTVLGNFGSLVNFQLLLDGIVNAVRYAR